MCGLAGLLARAPDGRLGAIAAELAARQRHRGPDGEGFWVAAAERCGLAGREALERPAYAVLGHRRLSIVDPAGGNQPMTGEDGRVWVTFNGEIYNHQRLRSDLQRRGHRFRTHCDTEVLVHGWEEWGERLFGKLNGIFAVALFDSRRAELVVARDPVGVKPLYVGVSGSRTWWCSELSAAIAAGAARTELSADALKLLLMFRFIPSPWAVLAHAWKVPPGHLLRLRRDQAGTEPVFRPFRSEVRAAAEPRSREEWAEALLGGLSDAVRRQLMADVAIGSLLSGGVDSTLVTQMMRQALPYVPHSYGIGFPSDGALNEAVAAERAACELGTVHHSLEVDENEYLARWPGMFGSVGEPVANVGGLLIGLLCEAASRDTKVVLTGQGADEPLGGYPRHVVERIYPWARHAVRQVAPAATRLLGADTGSRLARALATSDRIARYVDTLAVLAPSQVDLLVPDATPARELACRAVGRWVESEEPSDPVNEFLRLDTRFSLADDLLLIADHFSMRSSVELRVPFLDLEFLELVERMPSRYKVSSLGARKWLYRRGARAQLPRRLRAPLAGRRARFGPKRGFNAPVATWFAADGAIGDDRGWLSGLERWSMLSRGAVERLIAYEPDDGQNARKRVTLYALSQWLNEGPLARVEPLEPERAGRC